MNKKVKIESKMIHSKLIVSDPSYQRPIDYKRVKRIVSNFDERLVNEIKVSKRNGFFYVFDGQHTLAALKLRNKNQELPVACKVYLGLTKEEEARLFSEQNGIAKAVTTSAKMKALFVAGDEEITELHNLITSLGIKFDFSRSKGINKIVAYTCIYNIYKKTSKEDFLAILEIVRDSWNGDSESYNKEILNGMHLFYTTYKSEISKSKVVGQFSKVSPIMIIRDGKAFREGGSLRFARQLVLAYNKKLRVGKLEESKLLK